MEYEVGKAIYCTSQLSFSYFLLHLFPLRGTATEEDMQRQWLQKVTTQTHLGIQRSTRLYNPLVTSPQFHYERGDHQIFCDLLKACKLSSDMRTAIETHTRIIRFGYGTHPSLAASLVLTYMSCDHLSLAYKVIDLVGCWTIGLVTLNMIVEYLMRIGEYEVAKKVFYKMPAIDVVTWNTMIGGYVRNSRNEEALGFFRTMLDTSVEPDKFTFASVMSGCAELGSPNHAQWVHELLIKKRIELNHILSSALIDMYSKCGRIQTAKEVFNSSQCGAVSVWNSMISGLAVHGLALDAISVFSKMEAENFVPDSITFLALLTACSHCGLVKEGQHFFDLMRSRYSIQPQLEHYGAMVDLLGRAGLVDEAYAMIKAMPMETDAIIWRALLSACRTHKRPELGEVAISSMSHCKSGDYVLLSNIYCSEKKWDSAQGTREMMKKRGIRKTRGKSWIEWEDVIHKFKAGDRSHPDTEAIYKVLEGLIQRAKMEGYVPTTELVMMDVSEEEKEGTLTHHSEKLALAYGILKTSPGMEIQISKNLRICCDCHNLMKMVSKLLGRVIIVRDRIRFHQIEGGICSCGDYW